MKFYLHSTKNNIKEYTQRLIKYVGNIEKSEFVYNPVDADFVLCSVCDITESVEILKAKKYGKPVITGGMLSEVPIINELSDYVWHDEIYGFFSAIEKGDYKYITTRENKNLLINQTIKWEQNPVIKVGRASAYYYCGKGCPLRCKYCYIGNARDYQSIPERLYRNAENAIKKSKSRMMPIAAYNPYAANSERNITEVLLRDYVAHPQNFKNVKMIRSGIEFCSESYSLNFAKGVKIDIINSAIEISKKQRTKMILYFIAGLESTEEIITYFEQFSKDYALTPNITINFTYLQPQNYTPFYDFDLNEIKEIDVKSIFRAVNSINKRIKINPLANIKKSVVRYMQERTININEYNALNKCYNNENVAKGDLLNTYPCLVGTAKINDILNRKRTDKYPSYQPYFTIKP